MNFVWKPLLHTQRRTDILAAHFDSGFVAHGHDPPLRQGRLRQGMHNTMPAHLRLTLDHEP